MAFSWWNPGPDLYLYGEAEGLMEVSVFSPHVFYGSVEIVKLFFLWSR